MVKKKKSAPILESASARMAGVKSIAPDLDLGNGLSINTYSGSINALRETLEAYNTLLAEVDVKQNEFKEKQKQLKDLHERMLMGVGARFGKDSVEYTQAGGVRKSERKKNKPAVK
jgi:hypothetical protein